MPSNRCLAEGFGDCLCSRFCHCQSGCLHHDELDFVVPQAAPIGFVQGFFPARSRNLKRDFSSQRTLGERKFSTAFVRWRGLTPLGMTRYWAPKQEERPTARNDALRKLAQETKTSKDAGLRSKRRRSPTNQDAARRYISALDLNSAPILDATRPFPKIEYREFVCDARISTHRICKRASLCAILLVCLGMNFGCCARCTNL